MSVNDPLVRLGHMLEMALAIQEFVDGVDLDEFSGDLKLQLAVVHALQVIGEAAARIDKETRETYAVLPWQAMVGFRNIAVHEYFNVDPREVLGIATNSVPELIRLLRTLPIEEGP